MKNELILMMIGVVAYLISIKLIGTSFAAYKISIWKKQAVTWKAVLFFPLASAVAIMRGIDESGPTELSFHSNLILEMMTDVYYDSNDRPLCASCDGVDKFYAVVWPVSVAMQIALLGMAIPIILLFKLIWYVGVGAGNIFQIQSIKNFCSFWVKPV